MDQLRGQSAPGRPGAPAPGSRAQLRRRALAESLVVGAVVVGAVGTGIAGMWITSENTVRDNYNHYLTGLAQAAAEQVDPAGHAALRDPAQINGPEYRREVEPLRRLIRAVPDVRYIYTAVLDGDTVRFVLDASDPGDHDGDGVEDQSGVWEAYEDADPAMVAAFGRGGQGGEPQVTGQPYSDKWGTFMSGYAPLVDDAGHQFGVVGVDVDASVYLARLRAARNQALLGLVPAGLLVCGLGIAFYRTRLRGLLATADLKASEGKFRGLFELSPVGIALNDLQSGAFIEVNDALLAPTGYSRAEFLALSYWDITPGSYAREEQAQLESMRRTGRYGPYEKEYIRRDGSHYPVLLSGMRMTDASGREVIWSIVQDISQRKALESELTAAARRDRLTGLANRTLFMERLQRAIERVRANPAERFAVLFLDFDHFKLINDTLGHAAGDQLLRQVGDRLRGALRASDAMSEDAGGNVVARFGGDEFVVLINDLHSGGDAGKVAERLLNTLAPAYSVNGRDVHSTASIGIVTSEQCTESAEAVIRNADVAMYEAKRSGRACAVVFNEAMHVRLTRHVTIESSLRKALGTAQLRLVFQPIVELETGAMVSAEALLRWEHPQLGVISPAEFIPIAEESGLIVPLGEWVLHEACRCLVQWREADPGRAPASVSVNVSRAELALGPRLLERIRTTLARSGLPPGCLQLEVTEREVMRNPEASLRLMQELRALGVRLAMDDFGTGTSSLGCLRDYPFDVIKVDRSFVSDLAASRDVLAVIHATITLVENLGMASVAEGVESAAQVAILQSLGCRYAQGYFFSAPVPPAALPAALETRPAEVAAS